MCHKVVILDLRIRFKQDRKKYLLFEHKKTIYKKGNSNTNIYCRDSISVLHVSGYTPLESDNSPTPHIIIIIVRSKPNLESGTLQPDPEMLKAELDINPKWKNINEKQIVSNYISNISFVEKLTLMLKYILLTDLHICSVFSHL